mgnify:CR=1 FL=1
MRLLAGRGACICGDIVDELPLSQSTVSQHIAVLKEAGTRVREQLPEGVYLEIGNINREWKGEIDPSELIFSNRTMIGVSHYEAGDLKRAIDLVAATRTKYPWERVLSHVFPLSEINEAMEQQDKGHVTRSAIKMWD